MSDTQLKNAIDRANPNSLADAMRLLGFGQLLRSQTVQVLRNQDPALDAAQLATLHSIVLPDDCRASAILRGTIRAGGVTGELVVKLYGVTPGSGEIAVAPNGDIVVLAADAITDFDVTFAPERGDVVTLTDFPVVPGTGVLTIPAPLVARGVCLLIDADVTAGTTMGRKNILVPTSSAPATTKARLSIAKNIVYFAVADAVTTATVKLLVAAEKDLNDLLESEQPII